MVQVVVKFNNSEAAMRALKKQLQIEGVFKVLKNKRAHEKPSEMKLRKKTEAIRRKRRPKPVT